MQTFGTRLRWAREQVPGLSQSRLSKIAGLSVKHVSAIESRISANTDSAVETGTASKLAMALGVSLDWLIDGKEPPPNAEQIQAAIEAVETLQGSVES